MYLGKSTALKIAKEVLGELESEGDAERFDFM